MDTSEVAEKLVISPEDEAILKAGGTEAVALAAKYMRMVRYNATELAKALQANEGLTVQNEMISRNAGSQENLILEKQKRIEQLQRDRAALVSFIKQADGYAWANHGEAMGAARERYIKPDWFA